MQQSFVTARTRADGRTLKIDPESSWGFQARCSLTRPRKHGDKGNPSYRLILVTNDSAGPSAPSPLSSFIHLPLYRFIFHIRVGVWRRVCVRVCVCWRGDSSGGCPWKQVVFFFLFIHFVTQFRVHEYGVQVQNTLFQENNTLCSNPLGLWKNIKRHLVKMVGMVAQIPSLQLHQLIRVIFIALLVDLPTMLEVQRLQWRSWKLYEVFHIYQVIKPLFSRHSSSVRSLQSPATLK